MKNKLRRALLENRPAFGAWIGIAQPVSPEIFGRLGFDWAAVDLEHGVIGLESLANIFGALEGFGCVPVAEAKYPPQGRRGYGFCRANRYGLDFGPPAEKAGGG